MYITKLTLDKIRCFDHLEIDFTKNGQSLLLLGDNGEGKSTVLKSIAIGLCDESSASALFRELDGEFVRREKKRRFAKEKSKGTITIELVGVESKEYKIITNIISTETFETVNQKEGLFEKVNGKWKLLEEQADFPWKNIFISGYGAGSRTRGTEDFQHYLAVDATYSLFKGDTSLQNPELAIRRLMDAARKSSKDVDVGNARANSVFDDISEKLSSILDLTTRKSISLSKAGLVVKGSWGSSELGELGDGYKATIIWILDLLAWWFLRAGGWRLNKLNGIVVVDEIEQHLHPRWQRSIIPMLMKHFSGVQFILSTHSPLCAGSITAFEEKDFQLTRLKRVEGSVKAENVILERGLRADQILTSEAFSLIETRLIDLDPMIQRYKKLAIKKRLSPKYRTELETLRNELNTEITYIGESERDKEIYENIKKHIDKLAE
jgi:predicted ATP-binding protein involved in virulence